MHKEGLKARCFLYPGNTKMSSLVYPLFDGRLLRRIKPQPEELLTH